MPSEEAMDGPGNRDVPMGMRGGGPSAPLNSARPRGVPVALGEWRRWGRWPYSREAEGASRDVDPPCWRQDAGEGFHQVASMAHGSPPLLVAACHRGEPDTADRHVCYPSEAGPWRDVELIASGLCSCPAPAPSR